MGLPSLAVGFCDASSGTGFSFTQPADQLERWALPVDNGTHLLVDWHPHSSICGHNVTSYEVDVAVSMPLLNLAVDFFGSFPQNICSGSKARSATTVEVNGDVHPAVPPCSPYPSGCHRTPRRSIVPIPLPLRFLAKLDIELTIRATGSTSPLDRPDQSVPANFWCHTYRKAALPTSANEAAAVVPSGDASSAVVLAHAVLALLAAVVVHRVRQCERGLAMRLGAAKPDVGPARALAERGKRAARKHAVLSLYRH